MKQGNFENEEFIRVGTTLYKLVNLSLIHISRFHQGVRRIPLDWSRIAERFDMGKLYVAERRGHESAL